LEKLAEAIERALIAPGDDAEPQDAGKLVDPSKSVYGRAMEAYEETLEKAKAGDAEALHGLIDAADRLIAAAREGR
jgi:hypothetical protein